MSKKQSAETWRQQLTPEEYRVCRKKGTEAAFTGAYTDCQTPGVYRCKCCDTPLFNADSKYHSGSGWPSFWQAMDKTNIKETLDTSHGMRRVEVSCAACDAHLGHVFEDGPQPTGLRYCINSISLKLDPDSDS